MRDKTNLATPSLLMTALAGLGALLPGDVIHDTAPVSVKQQSLAEGVAQIEAAQAKRIRKAAKRRGR